MLVGESGLQNQAFECLDWAARSECRNRVKVIRSLSEFVSEQSEEFSDLVLENFQYIFLCHFLACSLVFTGFCVHHLLNFIGKLAFLWLIKLHFATSVYPSQN